MTRIEIEILCDIGIIRRRRDLDLFIGGSAAPLAEISAKIVVSPNALFHNTTHCVIIEENIVSELFALLKGRQ